MYRVVIQKFPEEAGTCFAEMCAKKVKEAANKKIIEGKFKVRCEGIKSIMDKIRQRLIDGLEPDKSGGAMFIGESRYKISGVIKSLLSYCGDIIKSKHKDAKENIDLIVSVMLLRIFWMIFDENIALIFKHACNILKRADLLLLYNAGDKNKKDILQDEVKKQSENSIVLSNVLMCHVTATTSCILL